MEKVREIRKSEVKEINLDLIQRNPDNPRLLFGQKAMDKLVKSIEEAGILVPLTVYEEKDKYMLIDGERRLMCAKKLNMPSVPANVIAPPTGVLEYLLRMFNIHNVKEDWKLMPTALKLKKIMEELETKDDDEVSTATGLPKTTVKRCKKLLDLPKKYQDMILNETAKELPKRKFSEDFFLEMMAAISSIKRFFIDIYDNYGIEGLIEKFVEKQRQGKIKNITDFRKINKIVGGARKGVPEITIKETLEKLIKNVNFTLDEAYVVVEPSYSILDIEKQCARIKKSLKDFTILPKEKKQRSYLVKELQELRDLIDKKIKELA